MTETNFTVGCVQLCSGQEIAANIIAVCDLIREAVDRGADLIVTPEMTGLMELKRATLFAKITNEADDDGLAQLCALAKELRRHIIIGSLAVKISDELAVNRSFLIGPDGEIKARYDKIHMFDVNLPNGESYRESRSYEPGDKAVIAALPWGLCGLTVCYDLRFSALYRVLAKSGADFITVPSAFTQVTGEAHWHVLLRARAIETGCFIFAPAQGGVHENGRATYGHGLIVSPWGEILAEGGEDPGVITAYIDVELIKLTRSRIPSLNHDRTFADPSACGSMFLRGVAS